MNPTEERAAICKAAQEIAERLTNLEREIGRTIESIDLVRHDVTKIEDTRPRYFRGIEIRIAPDLGAIQAFR